MNDQSQKNRLKVLLYLPTSEVGGAEKVATIIALGGEKYSLDVDLYCGRLHKPGIECFGVSLARMNFMDLFKVLRKSSYDVVFTTHFKISVLVAILRLVGFSQTKQLARESTRPFERFGKIKNFLFLFGYKTVYRYVDAVIFQSVDQCSYYDKVIPSSVPRHILPNPVHPVKERQPSQKYCGYKLITGCGRLIEEKGFDLLIKAFGELGLGGLGYQLKILGDGPCMEELGTLIHDLKLEQSVTLEGFVTNPVDYFRSAELCVVSSRLEGFPNVLLEMIDSCPRVISTDCAGGIADIPGILICDPNNLGSLKNALKSACINREDTFDHGLSMRSISNRDPEIFVSQYSRICREMSCE